MHTRFAWIAAIALMSTNAFAAEPATPAARQPSQQQPASPQMVLASADDVRTPAPAEQREAPQARPHRVARVTTCRCGDTGAQPDSQQ